jgi:outer membrane protein insertion porin family
VDSGTVTNQFGLDDYRVSVGTGLRISVPGLTPVPVAIDFGFPLVKQFLDQERVFSLHVDIPF